MEVYLCLRFGGETGGGGGGRGLFSEVLIVGMLRYFTIEMLMEKHMEVGTTTVLGGEGWRHKIRVYIPLSPTLIAIESFSGCQEWF